MCFKQVDLHGVGQFSTPKVGQFSTPIDTILDNILTQINTNADFFRL